MLFSTCVQSSSLSLRQRLVSPGLQRPQTSQRSAAKSRQKYPTRVPRFIQGRPSTQPIFQDSASSSTQESVCSVEPGTAQDVGLILQLVGARLQVKGGGHAWNPGFSSTTSVQIAMSRF
ncbi:hypothetical protein B0H11DRAFT_2249826 [Mycena galericulata]|nr:hypothetical protein B0H11DRAFT_2249826 [Mycena galericulata]